MTTTIGSLDLTSANSLYNDATQYFWFESDSTATYGAGVHITLSPSATFMNNPTGQNILINTDGFSLRNGTVPLMVLDNDSLDFNLITNLSQGTYVNVATFGTTGATIGQLGGAHSVIDANGQRFYASDGTTLLANIGYGEGTGPSGGAGDYPYFTFGSRYGSAGGYSQTFGTACAASGFGSFASGFECNATGNYSSAFGYRASAGGVFSFAEGGGKASGNMSHAEGVDSVADGYGSHVGGLGTYAEYDYQTVIGKYNDNKSTSLFEIGNGTYNTHSNAFEVDTSGNVNISSGAKYKINGTALSASDVGAVPTTRTVNNKALSSNITLTASDVSAVPTSGGTMTGQLLTSYKSSVAMGSYGSPQTTVPNFIAEVRMSSGCAGSVNIGTVYTANGVTIATGWYNFMYMPHRSGGKNGSADGDNANYGNLFLFGMNNANGRFIIRVSSGSIQEVSKIITTIEDKDYVTATGSDGIWKYRKWSSGRIECWGEKSWSSVACTTSAGGGYRSADVTQALPSGLFTAIDSCQATMKGSGGNGYTMSLRTLCTTTTISQMFWNTTNATKSTCTVDYYIIGT